MNINYQFERINWETRRFAAFRISTSGRGYLLVKCPYLFRMCNIVRTYASAIRTNAILTIAINRPLARIYGLRFKTPNAASLT